MARSSLKTIAIAIGIALSSIAGVIIIVVLFVGALILALIPLYTPNHSVEGFGDEYRINSMMLKSFSPASSCDPNPVKNGSVSDNSQLSDLCTTQFKKTAGSNIAGCLLKNFYGYGSCNDSTTAKRRRRATTYATFYTIGQARLFYLTTCGKPGDKNKYSNDSSLSNCVKKRLAACNSILGTSRILQEWGSVSSLAYIINGVIFPILKVYGVPQSLASSWADYYGGSADTRSQLSAGCQYIGPISHSAIAAILASQSETTTIVASSTVPTG